MGWVKHGKAQRDRQRSNLKRGYSTERKHSCEVLVGPLRQTTSTAQHASQSLPNVAPQNVQTGLFPGAD